MAEVSPDPLRVAITTLGCKVNYAEMAELSGQLAAGGCSLVTDTETADVHVVNSCTVTAHADATTRQRIARLRRQSPAAHIVVTGCSVDANPATYPVRASAADAPNRAVDAVFDNAHKSDIADHVIALAAGRRTTTNADPVEGAAPGRARYFLKAQDGCDHRCTYCIVWRARGASTSLPLADLVAKARRAVDSGYREIVLTGVDLGSWGRSEGTVLARLVTAIADAITPHARLRLSSVNANDIDPELIDAAAHPAVCPHWHMPLQSGSDAILKAMHRGYRRAHYFRVVDALRAARPDVEFTTDVMTGFPGETDADHADTADLVTRVGFLECHVFRWSPRPETPAAELSERVDAATARHRSADIRRLADAASHHAYAAAVGRDHDVVWDRIDTATNTAHGLTAGYHRVVAESFGALHAAISRVRADSAQGSCLTATLLAP